MTVVPPSAEKWVLASTILASSMAFIDSSAFNIALPTLQTQLGATGSELLWIGNAYLLFLASLILVGGSLGDHYGRKRVFMIGISVFIVASLLCGFAPDPSTLILWRALQGIGGALMVPGSLAIISASFAPERRGRAIGTWSTFSTLTTLLGPMLGGWLAGQGLWRAVFFINLPIGMIALAILALHVPESRDENAPKQLDLLGAVLGTLGLAGITYGFTQAPESGFRDPSVWGTLLGGIIAFIAFIVVEARSDHPMLSLRLFKSRTFTGANLLTLFLYGPLYVLSLFLPLNLQQIQGYPPEIAGIAFLPGGIMLALMGRWAGGLVDRVGSRLPLIVGPTIVGFGFLLFALPALTTGTSDYWTTYFPAAVVFGFGMGVTVAPLTTTVFASAPQGSAGIASGINNAVSRTAGVLSLAILGALALFFFGGVLMARTNDLSLSAEARTQLDIEALRLADADAPAGLDATTTNRIESAITNTFVDTFRLIMLICAGMVWISAGMSALLIDGRKKTS